MRRRREDEGFDRVDVVDVAVEAGEHLPGESCAVGLVGPFDGPGVVDRVMPPRCDPAEEACGRVDFAGVFKLLQRPEDLHEVSGAVVAPMRLAPAREQVGARGIHRIVESGR